MRVISETEAIIRLVVFFCCVSIISGFMGYEIGRPSPHSGPRNTDARGCQHVYFGSNLGIQPSRPCSTEERREIEGLMK